jgi:hypothetical protein
MVEYNAQETLQKVAIRLIILGKHTMSDSAGELPFEVLLKYIRILQVKNDQSMEILFRVSGLIVNETAGDVEIGLARTCLESYKHILEEISPKPDDLSVLFSMTDLILTTTQACLPYDKIDYKSSYKSEVRGYLYMNRILEVSVMAECNNSLKYFYISFRVSRIL